MLFTRSRWIYARIAHLPAAATTKEGRRIGPGLRTGAIFRPIRNGTGTNVSSPPFFTFFREPGQERFPSIPILCAFLLIRSYREHCFWSPNPIPASSAISSADGSHAHPLQTWESALPVRIQKLTLRYFFSERPERRAGSGLLKFRWPVSDNGEWKYFQSKSILLF